MNKYKATGSVEKLTLFSKHAEGCLFLLGVGMKCKAITGYEGKYEVNEYGSILSLKRKSVCGGKLKPGANKSGHMFIRFYPDWKNKKGKKFYVHRLVALAFVANPENKPCINHIDGNPKNNHFKNLEWCTHKENIIHSFDVLGRHHTSLRKISKENVIGIRNNYASNNWKGLPFWAKKNNVSVGTIDGIVKNQTYKEIVCS